MSRYYKKIVSVLLSTAMVGLSAIPPQMVFAKTEEKTVEKTAFDRQKFEFSDKWLYIKGDIQDARYLDYDDSNAEEVTLPHARDHYELYDLDLKDIQSVDWYRRHFTIPAEDTGKRIFVEFEGGGQKNAVYVNGGLVGEADGTFTHFKFDITDYISCGDFDNVIAVKVDSKFYENELPPGTQHDFYWTGGLHGDAFMTITDPVYVDSAYYSNDTVRNGDSNAVLHGKVTVKNTGKQAENIKVETVLVDEAGSEVILASQTVTVDSENSKEVDLAGTVENPRLWSLSDPYLYTVKTNLYAGDNIKIDNYEHTIGIRTFSVTPPSASEAHAYLNGEEIELLGVNKHIQAPYLMNSMPNRLHEEDAYTLKYDLGVNLVRTSHYQQDPAFLEACDKIGLLVEEEALGWGDTPGWNQFEYSVLEMVKRDINHPSIVMWSVIPNERRGVSNAECVALAKKVKELDPSRLTIQEEDQNNPLMCDIYGYHDYNVSGQLKEPPAGINSWLVTEWNTNLGKYFVIPGDSETRKLNSLVQESTKLSVFQSDPRVLGSLRWEAFGYLTSFNAGEKGKNINKYRSSGLYSLWKAPIAKTWLGYSFQAQGDPEVVGDVLKIGSEWKEDSPKEIWVVSNLDKVGLFYQKGTEPEVEVGIKSNSSSLPTAVGGTTNYKGLVKFTLPEGCEWAPDSKLITRGYRAGAETAAVKEQTVYASTYEVEKEGAKVVLHNVTSETGAGDTIRADGADMAYLVAEMQDKNGQKEYYGDENISARLVSGPGSLWYGKKGMTMIDGVSGFYVKSQYGVPGDTEVVVSVDIGDNYDDSWEQIVYDSNWQETKSQDAYHKNYHRAAAKGASVTIPFTGTQIALYGQNQAGNGTAAITIDGKKVGKADFNCLQKYGIIANQEVFRSVVLDQGEHTLVITADSAKPVNLDRVKVFDGTPDITSEPLTVTSESCSIEMVVCDPSLPKAEDKSLMTPSKEVNLALTAGITASGTTHGETAYLNDGKTGGTDYWAGTTVPIEPNETDSVSLYFDLGEREHTIKKIVSYYRNNAWPTAYTVQVSDDKVNWQTVEEVSYDDADIDNKVETLVLAKPVKNRYVAINYTKKNRNASLVDTVMLYEIELMGDQKPLTVREQLEGLVIQAEAVKREDFETSSIIALEKALEYAYNVLGILDFSNQDGMKALRQLKKALDALKAKANTVIKHTERADSEGIQNKVYYWAANPTTWSTGPDDTYANKQRKANDYYTVSFTGTRIQLFTKKSDAHGWAAVSIDGGEEKRVDMYMNPPENDQMFYDSGTLPYGIHKVKVRVTAEQSQNPTNASVGFSYAWVFGTDEMETALDELKKEAAEVEAIERAGYTLTSLEEVDRIWLEAVSLLRDSNRTLEKIKDCTKRLSDSIHSLETTADQGKADTRSLSEQLTELSALESAGYSESSWREFLYDIQSAVRTYHLVLTGQYPQVTIKDSPGITSVLIKAVTDELLNAKGKLDEIWVWDPSVIPPLVIAGGSQYTSGGSVKTEAYNQAVIALQQLGDTPGQQETEAALSVLEAAAITANPAAIQALMAEAEAMDSNPQQYTPEIYQTFRTAYDSLKAILAVPESLEIAKINGAASLRSSVDALKLDIKPGDVTVTNILVKQLPYKVHYKAGEPFDSAGLMITARFSDETELQLIEGSYTIEGFESDTEGEKTLTVVYESGGNSFTVQFTIVVEGKIPVEGQVGNLTKDLKKALKSETLTPDEKYEAVCSTLESLDNIEFTQTAISDNLWSHLQELENLIIEQSKGKIKTGVINKSTVASMSNATVKGMALSVPYTKASNSNATMVFDVTDAEVPDILPFQVENAVALDLMLNVESDDPEVVEEAIQPAAPVKVRMSIPTGVKKDNLVLLQLHDGVQLIPVKVTDNMEFYVTQLSLFVIANKTEPGKPPVNSGNDSDSDDSYTGEWLQDQKGWWYEMPNGTYPSSQWKMINGKWYWFDRYGYMETGWLFNKNRWYYLDHSGEMYKKKWLEDKNKWYYFGEDGAMLENQWLEDNKSWYYLYGDGSMAVSSLIDGQFQVGEDGIAG